MRILFLAPQPFYAERGTPIAVRYAVEELCRAGHEVDLLVYHEGADISLPGLRLFRAGRPPLVSKVPIGFSPQKLICDLWLAAKAYSLMLRTRYDVVHAVEESVFLALAARIARRFRLVYDMDSLMSDQIIEKWSAAKPVHPMLAWFEGFAARRSDLVLPVCAAIADRVRAQAPSTPVHLLPDVAPEAPASPPQAEDLRSTFGIRRPLALYVGNLETYQGIDLLLEGVAALPPAERVDLVVIGGDAAAVARYRERAGELGVADDVHFAGARPLAALTSYLAQADILCSPRLKGVNTPMKVYAYMMAGRALLATDILSHTQVLDDGCAALAPPTPAGIADGLRRLAGDAALRTRLGEAAAERARRDFSLGAFRRRLLAAYAELGAGRADEAAGAEPAAA